MYLYKKTQTGPRYACTILEDRETTDGYKINDLDPSVCDPEFVLQIGRTMTMPALSLYLSQVSDQKIMSGRIVQPKEAGHFESAVRSVPGSCVGAVGRN